MRLMRWNSRCKLKRCSRVPPRPSISGLNWNASIMALKFLGSSGSGFDTDAINAMEFALQVKALFASTATPVNLGIELERIDHGSEVSGLIGFWFRYRCD